MEELKKEIQSLQTKQGSLEKEINASNARYEAHVEMLKKEFGIASIEEIDELIKKENITAEELKKILQDSMMKVKLHIKNLEVLMYGK